MKIMSEMSFPQDSSDNPDSSSVSNMGVHACMVCESQEFKYTDKDLWLSHDEIAGIRMVDSEKLLNDKKIVLVLNLDNTLLHTTKEKRHLKTPEEDMKHTNKYNDSIISLKSLGMMTKLRPNVQTFLEEASTMFEMYIYLTQKK
ncbi:RNA polymerase II C-terminal domain phosphatase-like 4 [Castanea sativa]|uniref:RNA polymerase II C-terminal domain phosphatase-like 4 n=1 Tax=Castanea sativa TaxID=21020 RepID=UPI003F650A1F